MTLGNYCIFIASQDILIPTAIIIGNSILSIFYILNQINSITLTRLSYEKDVLCHAFK